MFVQIIAQMRISEFYR